MAINRFDVYQPQGHVSQYVPLPFEQLAAVGQQMQKNYESALTDVEDLPKLLKDAKGLKEVTGYGEKGLGKYYVGDLDMINAYNLELKNKLNTMTDDIMSGKLKGSEYKTEISKLKNQIQSDIAPTGAIGQATARYNTYQKNLEEMQKAKDLNKASWLAAPIYENVGQFLRGQGDIQTAYVGDYVDRNKELNDALSHIKSEGSAWAGTDGKYIREGSWEKVSPEKIKGAFEGWFENSAAKGDIENELKHRVLTGRVANTEEAMNTEYNRLKNNLYKEALYLYQSSKQTSNLQGDPNYGYTREDEMFNAGLEGEGIEGPTLNLRADDKEFASLIDLGIYKKNANGTYSVDSSKLKEKSKIEEGSVQGSGLLGGVPIPVYKTVDSNEKKKALESHIKKMASMVGESNIAPTNYDNILNKYAAFSAARMGAERMSAPMMQVQTNKVNTNLNSYTVMDPENPDKPLGRIGEADYQVIPGKDKIQINQFEITPKGKINRKGYILRQDGTQVPISVRSEGLFDTKYHDELGDLSLRSANYEAGIVKERAKDAEGTKIVDVKQFPGLGYLEAFEATGADGSKKVAYLFTPESSRAKELKPQTFTNQTDMLTGMDALYFETKQGKADKYNLISGSKTFTEIK